MSVYAEIAAALLADGTFPMPDGKRYAVKDIAVGDGMRVRAMIRDGADEDALTALFLRIAEKVTGVPAAICEELSGKELAALVAVSQHGADQVGAAMQAEALASGNAPAPTAAQKTSRSTSRKKR